MRFLDLAPEAMRTPSVPGRHILGDRGENLSSVLQQICAKEDRKDLLISWVRELTPLEISDFRFIPDLEGKILLALVDSDGNVTSAHSASDGTLRFLALLATFLGDDSASLYFFEDLETGLHPTRLHLLLDLIESRVRKDEIQVIATTHSPQLLAFLSESAQKDALVAYRKAGVQGQRLRRLYDLPGAPELFEKQGMSKLYSAGWLEDAIDFEESDES